MPTHRQLVFVRDHARLGREECRSRFLRQWPDEADFARCWAAAAQDAERERGMLLPPLRQRALVAAAATAAMLLAAGIFALLGEALPKGLAPMLVVTAAVAVWYAVRYARMRREADAAFPADAPAGPPPGTPP